MKFAIFGFWAGGVLFFSNKALFVLYFLLSVVAFLPEVKRSKKIRLAQTLKTLFVLIFFTSAGFYMARRAWSESESVTKDGLSYYDSEFSGVVEKSVSKIDGQTLTIENVVFEDRQESFQEKVDITMPLFPKINKGSEIGVKCKLREISEKENEFFSYKKYQISRDVYYQCNYPKVEILENCEGIVCKIYDLRENFLTRFQAIFPEPASSIVSGLTLGEESGLNEHWKKKFQGSGLTHILVVSGSNITLMIVLAEILLRNFVRRQARVIFAVLFAFFYSFLVGFDPPVVRAFFMALIVALGKITGRETDSKNILLFFGLVYSIFSPLAPYFNVSFLLSFWSSYGILLYSSSFSKFLLKLKISSEIFIESFATTLSAQLGVFPILLLFFDSFRPVQTFVANLLVLWVVPFVTIFGFVILLISFISTKIAIWFGFIEWVVIEWILLVADFFG